MRTTLSIDDDVLEVVKEMARTERKSIGELISSLARTAMRPTGTGERVRNGVPLLSVTRDSPRVTTELVKQLGEELP